MACNCEKCGNPAACGEKYCDNCIIDQLQTDTEKNLYAGGQFYPSVRDNGKSDKGNR